MAVSSCGTVPWASKKQPDPVEPKVIEVTKYLPGRVVVTPPAVPDSKFVQDAKPLSTAHIKSDDITAKDAIATALDWAGSYHEVKGQYYTLRGWVAGVIAGAEAIQNELDKSLTPEQRAAINNVIPEAPNDED